VDESKDLVTRKQLEGIRNTVTRRGLFGGMAALTGLAAAAGFRPGMTAAQAALRCLRSFGARRLWLAAPYPPATTQTAADFMIAHGFEVLSLECLSVDQATRLKKVPLEATY